MSGSLMMGQCFVRPMLFDRWLRALDAALASFGATRGRIALGNAKSSARLLCPPERFHEFSGWDTAYVRDTVVVLSPDAGATALGSAFALVSKSTPALGSQCAPAMSCAPPSTEWIMHPTELVLTRQCADVSKLLYHMRINGDILDHDLLASFDGQLRASVATLSGGRSPGSLLVAGDHRCCSWGVGPAHRCHCGSPGSFVASRILSRPLVATMVDHLCAAIGGLSPDNHG